MDYVTLSEALCKLKQYGWTYDKLRYAIKQKRIKAVKHCGQWIIAYEDYLKLRKNKILSLTNK
jgi:hypothetical protein